MKQLYILLLVLLIPLAFAQNINLQEIVTNETIQNHILNPLGDPEGALRTAQQLESMDISKAESEVNSAAINTSLLIITLHLILIGTLILLFVFLRKRKHKTSKKQELDSFSKSRFDKNPLGRNVVESAFAKKTDTASEPIHKVKLTYKHDKKQLIHINWIYVAIILLCLGGVLGIYLILQMEVQEEQVLIHEEKAKTEYVERISYRELLENWIPDTKITILGTIQYVKIAQNGEMFLFREVVTDDFKRNIILENLNQDEIELARDNIQDIYNITGTTKNDNVLEVESMIKTQRIKRIHEEITNSTEYIPSLTLLDVLVGKTE